eukprot:gene4766-6686_t
MLSLNQTFDDTRTIKVLVVPVGNNSLFDNHFQVVSRLRDVPFYELNRPRGSSSPSAFKYMNWNEGKNNLLFDYLRYDRVPNGPGDLDNFQSSRRVLMVMGLINYPELGEMADKIEEELDYFTRRHPNVVLRRLFVFNFSFDTVSEPPRGLSNDSNSMVIFPPEGNCEGGSMVDVHLKEVMSHAAVKIILSLENQMELWEDARVKNAFPPKMELRSAHDDMIEDQAHLQNKDSLLPARNLKKSIQKKPSGRIHKWMGDLSLQVCSPIDAAEHYSLAISECRALGDSIWLAGALDGYAATILLLIQLEFNLEEVIGRDLKSIMAVSPSGNPLTDVERGLKLAEERANEAISIYSKSVVFCSLEVECTLRLARMHESSENNFDKEQKVMDYVLKASAVPGLNSQQHIECTLEGGLICHRLGMKRKYALFLYVAALMCADSGNYAVAHTLIHYASYQYGISTDAINVTPLNMTTTNDGYGDMRRLRGTSNSMVKQILPELCVYDTNASWTAIRASLFTSGVLMAQEQGDFVSSTRFLSALLRLMSELEKRHSSERKKWENIQSSSYLNGLERIFNAAANANIPLGQTYDNESSKRMNSTTVTNNSLLTEESLKRLQTQPPVNRSVSTAVTLNNNYGLDNTVHSKRSVNSIADPENNIGSLPGVTSPNIPRLTNQHRSRSLASAEFLNLANGNSSGKMDVSNEYWMNHSSVSGNNNTRRLQVNKTMSSSSYNLSLTAANAATSLNSAAINQQGIPSAIALVSRQGDDGIINLNLTEFSQNASDTLRDGFRSLTVPKLPPQLISLVSKGQQVLQNGVGEQLLSTFGGNGANGSVAVYTGAGYGRSAGGLFSNRNKNMESLNSDNNRMQLYEQTRNFFSKLPEINSRGQTATNLSDRLLKTIAELGNIEDILIPNTQQSDKTSQQQSGVGVTIVNIELSQASDIMRYLSHLLSSYSIPIDQQGEALGLFNFLSQKLQPCSPVQLPVYIKSLKPIELNSSLRPFPIETPSMAKARKNLESLKDSFRLHLSSAISHSKSDSDEDYQHDSAEMKSPDSPNKHASALFYDPFAAKRAKNKAKKSTEVLWSVGMTCKFEVILSNPMSVPLSLDNIIPIVEGADCRTYNCTVIIPRNIDDYMIELSITPLQIGTIRVTAVQIFMNNAMHITRIDEMGIAVESEREISIPEFYPRRVLSSKQIVMKNNNSKKSDVKIEDKSTLKSKGIATNEVKVVPCAPNFDILFSWTDLKKSTMIKSSLQGSNNDDLLTDINLELLADELREENLKIIANQTFNSNNNNNNRQGICDIRVNMTYKQVSIAQDDVVVNTTPSDFVGPLSFNNNKNKNKSIPNHNNNAPNAPNGGAASNRKQTVNNLIGCCQLKGFNCHSENNAIYNHNIDPTSSNACIDMDLCSSPLLACDLRFDFTQINPNQLLNDKNKQINNQDGISSTAATATGYTSQTIVEVKIDLISNEELLMLQLINQLKSVDEEFLSEIGFPNSGNEENQDDEEDEVKEQQLLKCQISYILKNNWKMSDLEMFESILNQSLYARRITAKIYLCPNGGVLMDSGSLLRQDVQVPLYENNALLYSLSMCQQARGVLYNRIATNNKLRITSNNNCNNNETQALTESFFGNHRINPLVEIENIYYKITNCSGYPMLISSSQNIIRNFVNDIILSLQIKSNSSYEQVDLTLIQNQIMKILNENINQIFSYNIINTKGLLVFIPPHGSRSIIISYPYKQLITNDHNMSRLGLVWAAMDANKYNISSVIPSVSCFDRMFRFGKVILSNLLTNNTFQTSLFQ